MENAMQQVQIFSTDVTTIHFLKKFCQIQGYNFNLIQGEDELLNFINDHQALDDIVLIDQVSTNGLDSLEILKQIKKTHPDTIGVFFTDQPEENTVKALQAGAYAVIVKPLNEENLKELIVYIDRAIHQRYQEQGLIMSVMHELVGPLAGIRAWCEYLVDVKMVDELRDPILKRIFNQSGRVQRYVLNFAYVYATDQHLEQSFTARARLIKQPKLVELLINYAESFQGETKNRHIRGPHIDRGSFEDFPELRLDEHLFEMLILNLYDNAVKYSCDGQTITVSGRVLDTKVEIEITNYGIPLKAKDTEKVFERGMRSDEAIEFAPTGTGIGLFTSRRLARIHDGDIIGVPSPTTNRSDGNEVKFILSLSVPGK